MTWINELAEGTRVRHLDGATGTVCANDNFGREAGIRDVAWDDGDFGAVADDDVVAIDADGAGVPR